MNFVIPAGSSANLPKEMIKQIVTEAVEKSVMLKLIDVRGQMVELLNEGTLPVLGEDALDKVYRLDTTADITALTENDFTIKTPDLAPVEMGTFMRLKVKQLKQYPELELETLFKTKMSRAIGRSVDYLITNGDTTAVGATNYLNIADGVVALATAGAVTAVNYTTSESDDVCDAVIAAKEDLGAYGDDEYAEDLVLLASSDFAAAARKQATKDNPAYEIADYAPLGLKKIVFVHGIPIVVRRNITGEKAILANMKGAFAGYYGDMMEVDMEHEAGRRDDLLVLTWYFDFKWAFLNSSSEAEGMVLIQKAS